MSSHLRPDMTHSSSQFSASRCRHERLSGGRGSGRRWPHLSPRSLGRPGSVSSLSPRLTDEIRYSESDRLSGEAVQPRSCPEIRVQTQNASASQLVSSDRGRRHNRGTQSRNPRHPREPNSHVGRGYRSPGKACVWQPPAAIPTVSSVPWNTLGVTNVCWVFVLFYISCFRCYEDIKLEAALPTYDPPLRSVVSRHLVDHGWAR